MLENKTADSFTMELPAPILVDVGVIEKSEGGSKVFMYILLVIFISSIIYGAFVLFSGLGAPSTASSDGSITNAATASQ